MVNQTESKEQKLKRLVAELESDRETLMALAVHLSCVENVMFLGDIKPTSVVPDPELR